MRFATAHFAAVLIAACAGCQCSPLLEPSGDLVDNINNHPPRAQWLYHPGWDLNRIGKPDWCASAPVRFFCRRQCARCLPHAPCRNARCVICAQAGLDVTQNPLTRGLSEMETAEAQSLGVSMPPSPTSDSDRPNGDTTMGPTDANPDPFPQRKVGPAFQTESEP